MANPTMNFLVPCFPDWEAGSGLSAVRKIFHSFPNFASQIPEKTPYRAHRPCRDEDFRQYTPKIMCGVLRQQKPKRIDQAVGRIDRPTETKIGHVCRKGLGAQAATRKLPPKII